MFLILVAAGFCREGLLACSLYLFPDVGLQASFPLPVSSELLFSERVTLWPDSFLRGASALPPAPVSLTPGPHGRFFREFPPTPVSLSPSYYQPWVDCVVACLRLFLTELHVNVLTSHAPPRLLRLPLVACFFVGNFFPALIVLHHFLATNMISLELLRLRSFTRSTREVHRLVVPACPAHALYVPHFLSRAPPIEIVSEFHPLYNPPS